MGQNYDLFMLYTFCYMVLYIVYLMLYAYCYAYIIIVVYREKELLMTALSFLDAHEREAQASDFPYQLETKVSVYVTPTLILSLVVLGSS